MILFFFHYFMPASWNFLLFYVFLIDLASCRCLLANGKCRQNLLNYGGHKYINIYLFNKVPKVIIILGIVLKLSNYYLTSILYRNSSTLNLYWMKLIHWLFMVLLGSIFCWYPSSLIDTEILLPVAALQEEVITNVIFYYKTFIL